MASAAYASGGHRRTECLWVKFGEEAGGRVINEGINVMDYERKLQILDITIAIVLFIIGYVAGKLMMVYASDTWLSFNGPALGVFFIGELVWWRIRKKLIKKWEED